MPLTVPKAVPFFLNIILSIQKNLITIFKLNKILFLIPSKEHNTPNNNHDICYVVFCI